MSHTYTQSLDILTVDDDVSTNTDLCILFRMTFTSSYSPNVSLQLSIWTRINMNMTLQLSERLRLWLKLGKVLWVLSCSRSCSRWIKRNGITFFLNTDHLTCYAIFHSHHNNWLSGVGWHGVALISWYKYYTTDERCCMVAEMFGSQESIVKDVNEKLHSTDTIPAIQVFMRPFGMCSLSASGSARY